MDLEPEALADQIARIAVLEEPLRRALYFFVSGQRGEVSRDQAAAALHVSRALAAFHLDKLVEAGLLEVEFKRISGRRGPGAGRPSKLYRTSRQQLEVSVPERRYQLAAKLLLEAVEALPGEAGRRAAFDAARAWGRRLGAEARNRAPKVDAERLFEEALEVLQRCGFEPQRDADGNLRLRNCPFDALANEHRDLVCSMNAALMEGLLDGLELDRLRAKLMPEPGMCCVVLCREPGASKPTTG